MKNYLFSIRRIVFGFFLLFIVFFVRGQVYGPITFGSGSLPTDWTNDSSWTFSTANASSGYTTPSAVIREATSDEVSDLKKENARLKEMVADLVLRYDIVKKSLDMLD